MSLKRLVLHVTEITGWWKDCLLADELDFAKPGNSIKEINSTEQLLAWHDELVSKAEQILNNIAENEFSKSWAMRSGDQVYFT